MAEDKPLSVRLSAVDYLEGGLTVEDTVEISRVLKAKGVDLMDISSGGILSARIETGPGYQVPFAEAVRKGAKIPTIAVGLITTAELAQRSSPTGAPTSWPWAGNFCATPIGCSRPLPTRRFGPSSTSGRSPAAETIFPLTIPGRTFIL